ncbi:Homeodomain-interacting protein kinase 2 [Takifugu flavidus]|uniref:Homeodomain-interacting protein kinase 2 n=1 Tax=Takifugu flavidus TaxID=433684 RepID=A0A5C6NCE6_9TELE|nr:Homeodomain-interacting protein kinase 2 [Takifugu flavidus]
MEAVKVMKSRTGVIEKAKHEIQILKQLRRLDPNTRHVVRFNSFFFNMEDICLSFEFLDVDLHAYICETRLYETGLPLPEVRHIMEQLVMALHQLKTIGIIHVDIKPGNVMIVDRHEKPLRVKLVDFGGAQMSGNVDFETCICTQMYSAPEVLLRSEMNEALDMWSLGVTAFELAVGTPMFPYRRRYRLLNSIIKILGQPPDHVLDKGQQTKQFFNRKTNDHPSWTIKTAEEYGVSDKEDVFNCFDDVAGMLSVLQEHATGLDLFIDLLKNMLQVDPNQRITPVEALQHLFFTVKEEKAKELETTSKDPCMENIPDIQTNYAVDQLVKPEHVQPETVVSQENPAEVQPDNSGEDQLNDGFQTEDNTLNYNCFVNTLRTVGQIIYRTDHFDWFGGF